MHDCVHDRYVAALHASGSVVRTRTVQAVESVHSCEFGAVLDPLTGRTSPRRSVLIEMIDLLDPRPKMRVLEIGTGSGYATALMHAIVGDSGYLETVECRTERFRPRTGSTPAANLRPLLCDGLAFEPEPMGFERVVIWPPVTRVPMRLCEALGPEGRLLCTLDRPDFQVVVEIERIGAGFAVNPVKIVARRSSPAAGRLSEIAVNSAAEGVSELTKAWAGGPGGRVVDFWGWLINTGVSAFLWPQPGPEVMWLDVGDLEDWARLRVAGRELRGTRSGVARLQDRFGEWCEAGRPFLADNPIPWNITASPVGECLTPAWRSITHRRAEPA